MNTPRSQSNKIMCEDLTRRLSDLRSKVSNQDIFDAMSKWELTMDIVESIEVLTNLVYQDLYEKETNLKVSKMHHAQECKTTYLWTASYFSKDENGNIQAVEFRCNKHRENFWLAIPYN